MKEGTHYILSRASFQDSDYLIDHKTQKLAVLVNGDLHEIKEIGQTWIRTKSHGPAEHLIQCFEPMIDYIQQHHPTTEVQNQ